MNAYEDVQATILLVDDRPENLLALEAVLEPLGHRLLLANSGEEALKYLLIEDVALILLDVRMPGMSGFETAIRAKERDRTREIPIIFLTAYSADAAQVVQGFSTGAVDYITKPFDPWLLRSKVRVFVELYQKTRVLREQSEILALRLDEHYEAEARNLRKLADAAVVINSTLSLDEILRVINESAREVIGAREADTVILTADDELPAMYRLVLERHKPVRMTKKQIQTSLVSRGLFDIAPGHPMLEGWLAVPLIGRTGRTLGLIQVADKVEGDFSESDEVVLLQLAQLAAVAIENAERYEQERRIAETLQRYLLPEALPKIFGLDLAVHYQAGSRGTEVGGDWYDVFALDGQRVAFAVGDVVGRGPRAAAVMGQLRTAIRAVCRGESYFSPAVAGRLREALREENGARTATVDQLTGRERDVLLGVAQGKTNKEIGTALGISHRTVETHRESLMRKLQIRTVAELTRFALAAGVLEE